MIDDNKVVPFPPPAGSPEPDPIAKRHQRLIFSIGSQRLAFDFYHEVTKLRNLLKDKSNPLYGGNTAKFFMKLP